MKVIINKCFGGYSLSPQAVVLGVERGSRAVKSIPNAPEEGSYRCSYGAVVDGRWYTDNGFRQCPIMVAIVEELGELADGFCAKLKVVEIPDGIQWHIEDYDGIEAVHEDHRVWS